MTEVAETRDREKHIKTSREGKIQGRGLEGDTDEEEGGGGSVLWLQSLVFSLFSCVLLVFRLSLIISGSRVMQTHHQD